MNRNMTRNLVMAAALGVAAVAVSATAQMHGRGMMAGGAYAEDGPRPGYGYGPGMMGGGYGPGMMQGYGPGMMMGPGMMQGPGMGMMGGYGPGMGMMMGGYGPGMGMMGPGMMGGFGAGLDLSESQRERIAEIQQGVIDSMWEHMRAMHRQMPLMWQARPGEKIDVDEAMKAHEAMMAAGRAMMRQRLEAHNAMLDVLTDEQREQLRESYRRGGRWSEGE